MTEACQFCGSTTHETVSTQDRHGKPLTSVVCMGCGIVTNDPIPSDEALAAFYTTDYRKDYKGADKPRMRQVWRNFKRIEDHIAANRAIYATRKRCLDLGSGSGEFTFMAGRLGMACQGVEPNRDYSAYSRDELGLNVATQTLEETEFADGSFDLIRLSHVLEHMREPVRSLKTLGRWLSDDGVLYVEVPNIEQEAAQKMRGKLFHFGHIFNFNPFTLRLAAGLAGFEELPDSRARLSGGCGAFFVKASSPELPSKQAMTENARRMKAALDAHNARLLPQPEQGSAFGRFLSINRQRLTESLAARRFATHREIAEHFGRRL